MSHLIGRQVLHFKLETAKNFNTTIKRNKYFVPNLSFMKQIDVTICHGHINAPLIMLGLRAYLS
ncbi:MAG: hypothetical protein RIR97_1524 [Pseudomonadota bacterium]